MIEKDLGTSRLKEISPEQIQRNPENPRLIFRSEEMASLMASIKRYGIQVPITVYRDGDHYTLIDGERRWRCADKLNLKKIPALIQPKPTPLDNLLLMFNIHSLREQWDYMTIANKLPEVIKLFVKERRTEPNEIELSEATGLTRGQIRRCRLLLDLPQRYKDILLTELSLPKQNQQLSEDFFIEMERALKTVQNRVPTAISDIDEVRNALIEKFRSGVIDNVTDFRKLSKIATSVNNLGVRETQAKEAIKEIFNAEMEIGIDEIYAEHYELRYDERKVILNIESVADYLESISEEEIPSIGQDIVPLLKKLRNVINRVLEEYK